MDFEGSVWSLVSGVLDAKLHSWQVHGMETSRLRLSR